MFLFLRKYGVEMSRAESPVSSYTCADLAAPNWRRRIGLSRPSVGAQDV